MVRMGADGILDQVTALVASVTVAGHLHAHPQPTTTTTTTTVHYPALAKGDEGKDKDGGDATEDEE